MTEKEQFAAGGFIAPGLRCERDEPETIKALPVTQRIEVAVTRRARLYLWIACRLARALEMAIDAAGIPCRVAVSIDEDRANLDRLVKIRGLGKLKQ
jgi:hypothetical protein